MTQYTSKTDGATPAPCDPEEPAQDSFDAPLRELARLSCPADALPGLPALNEVVAGKYRVDELIARGGMGAVFRATHVVSGRQLALKWLLPGLRGGVMRFVGEAQAAGKIDHPNVVDVHDVGAHAGGRYLVMELLRGQTLAERIETRPLTPPELLQIIIPVLRGLMAVHAQGVIHRDLKPSNVFLCTGPDGSPREPKLLDFGVSKIRQTADSDQTLTDAGTALGTIAYMPPEQLVDARAVDERADIYAAGVMMYEALTGQRPFRAHNSLALALAIAAEEPRPLRELAPETPAALHEVVQRAMAKVAADRYPSVEALLRALEDAASQPDHGSAPSLHRGSGWRRRGRAAALVLLSLGVAGSVWAGAQRFGRTEPARWAALAPKHTSALRAPSAPHVAPSIEAEREPAERAAQHRPADLALRASARTGSAAQAAGASKSSSARKKVATKPSLAQIRSPLDPQPRPSLTASPGVIRLVDF